MRPCATPPLVHRLTAVVDDLVGRAGGPTGAVFRLVGTAGSVAEVTRGARQTHDGTRALERPLPMTDDTVFDVGSITKVAATTCLAMRLYDNGLLHLDDPVSRWYGPFARGPKREVTVRQLLSHRAGLWEWWPTYAFARDAVDALAYVASMPPRYPPGAGRHYSDLGFMLLGGIIERVAGKGLAELTGELFGRLGLANSGFGPPPDLPVAASSHGDRYERSMLGTGEPYPVGVHPRAFSGWRTHTLVGEVNDGNAFHAFGGVAGHAGLFTTAADLGCLGRALLAALHGDGAWSAGTVRAFTTPGEDPEQALGFRTSRVGVAGERVVGHSGFPGAEFAILPDAGLVAVLLTNRLHTWGEVESIAAWWQRVLTVVVSSCG